MLPPRDTLPPPLSPLPAVTVNAPDPVKLLFAKVPATSAVAKSTALVAEPEPMKIDEVKVLLTIASVTELAGNDKVPVDNVNPLEAVRVPATVNAVVVLTKFDREF